MRNQSTRQSVEEFMRSIARQAKSECRVYFTGGATAVLMEWRESTVYIDIKFEPELDEVFRSIADIKENLQINVELAAPSDFIPPLPGWRDRCQFIGREGKISFYHYDLYSQALAKIERGHTQDIADVLSMLDGGFIERDKLFQLFEAIKPNLYKYPAIDPANFSEAVTNIISRTKQTR